MTLYFFLGLVFLHCTNADRAGIVEALGSDEYERLMHLSLDQFDQSSTGFRQYSDRYGLVSRLIPEYILVNNLSANESRNLHWHLGQMHAFDGTYGEAIQEMKQSYAGGSKTWECYVTGTIAFLEKDKASLEEALFTLRKQDNQMNIEFLEKFVQYFDKPYKEAYNAE
ncbi:MAG: hypothetical protein OEQ53_13825 [Saprospiraceae bacterium]|nr:hypothetical protein [Saprospiraceae bacterium]